MNLLRPIIDLIRAPKPMWLSGSNCNIFWAISDTSLQFLSSIFCWALESRASTSSPGPNKFADFFTNSNISLLVLTPWNPSATLPSKNV